MEPLAPEAVALKVRDANVTDLPWLIEQAQAFARYLNTERPVVGSPDRLASIFVQLIEAHVVLICEDKAGERIGAIAGTLSPHLYNPNLKVLSESFWWVPNEFRGSILGGRAASLLLDEFIERGKRVSDVVGFSCEPTGPFSPRTLTRRGFVPDGKRYVHYMLEVQKNG